MYNEYIIKENDTLSKIARDNNISLEELATANEWEDLQLEVGQKIIIPTSDNRPFSYYIVQTDDTLYSVADAYGMDVNDLAALNKRKPDQALFANERLLIPNEGYNFYITKEQDTIKNILKQAKQSYEALEKLNETIYVLPEQLIIYKD